MKDLRERFYKEDKFDKYTVDEINEFIEARVMSRNVPLYDEGIYKVLEKRSYNSLIDTSVEVLDLDEVLDRMPGNLRKNYVVPSIKGDYLTVIECTLDKTEGGEYEIDTIGRTDVIPIELVINTLSENQAVLELMD